MFESVGALPEHPLSREEVRALDQHDAFESCIPIFRLAGESGAVVVLSLEMADCVHVLSYNPADQSWERVIALDVPESITDMDHLQSMEIDEKLLAHYDRDDLEPVELPSDPASVAVGGLPEEALSDAQLETVESRHPLIGGVLPLVKRSRDGRTVALILVTSDIDAEELVLVCAGYEPAIDAWKPIYAARGSAQDRTEALERLKEAYAVWLSARYSEDEIYPVEDPEGELDGAESP